MANFVTAVRSPVQRDRDKRDLEYAPEPEMPARFARQLAALAEGVAAVCGKSRVDEEDLNRVARVTRDCIPPPRRAVLERLVQAKDDLTTTEVRDACPGMSKPSVGRTLEDLEALGVVARRGTEVGSDHHWWLRKKWRPIAERCLLKSVTQPTPGEGEDHHAA